MSQSQDEEIRRQAKKAIARRGLYADSIVCLVIFLALWAIWFFTGAGYPWPVFPTFGLALTLGIHTVAYRLQGDRLLDTPWERRERMIQEEMSRLRELAQQKLDRLD